MENRKSIGLPGGPNEFLKEITQHISVEGYKRYSKDVNNPYNIIESGNITMEDVDFPVKGTDNLGNEQMMMPGMNYQFPGDSVLEVPMAQVGGEQATLSAYEEPAWYEKALDYLASPMTTLSYLTQGKDLPDRIPIKAENRNEYDTYAFDILNPAAWLKYATSSKRNLEQGNYIDAGFDALGALPVVPATLSQAKKVLPNAYRNLSKPIIDKAKTNFTQFINDPVNINNPFGFQRIGDTQPLSDLSLLTPENIDLRKGFANWAEELSMQQRAYNINYTDQKLSGNYFEGLARLRDQTNKNITPFGKPLGSGIEGTVYEFANYPESVLKHTRNFSNKRTDINLPKEAMSFRNNATAIPLKGEKVFDNFKNTEGAISLMDNLNIVGLDAPLNLSKRNAYADLLKRIRKLRDSGIEIDANNKSNVRFNKDKGVYDIFDLQSGKGHPSYMKWIDQELRPGQMIPDKGSKFDFMHGGSLPKAQDGTEVEEKSIWGLVKEMAKVPGANISNLLGVMGIPANLIAEATESFTGRGDGEFNFMDAMSSFATPGSDDEIFTFTNQNGTPVKNVAGLEDAEGNPLVENPVGAFITNLATDPSTYVGAGVAKNVAKKIPKFFNKQIDNFKFKNLPTIEKKPFMKVVDGEFDTIDYDHLIPTTQEISDLATKTRSRLMSDKFIKNNMEATGRSKDEVVSYVDDYIKEFENSTLVFDKTRDGAAGLYTRGKITIDPRNPHLTKENVLGTLEHEIEHMFSNVGQQGSDLYRHPTLKLVDATGMPNESLIQNMSQAFEQQVRFRKALGWLEKNAGLKVGDNVTDEQVEALTDAIANWSKEGGKDFRGTGANFDIQHLFSNLDAEQFLKPGQFLMPNAPRVANLKNSNVRQGIKDILNKTYAVGAVGGLGAASQMGPKQEDGQYQQGGSLPKAQVGDKVASIASQMEVNEEDGGRPPLGVVDHIIALFDEEGLCRDNTCVQTVKDFYSKAGVKAMPEDVYNNREFLKNFKEYGFEEILDQKNLQPGDVLQYYYNKDSEGIDVNQDLLNFPYHMGVYVNPGEYIGDGDSESPIQRQNMYTGTRKDGTEYKKDPFRAFRYIKQNKNGGSLPKAQDGREHEIAVVPDSKAIENSFQRQWLDSPMYNEMLANEVGPGDDSEFLTFGRKSNLENLPISMTSGKHEDDEGIAADVDNVSGRITFYEPSQIGGGGRVYKNMFEHEVGHSSDRMSDETEKKYIESLSLMDKAALAIQNYGGKANEAYNFITGQDSNDFQDRGRQIERNLNVDILIPEKTIQGFTDQRFNIEGYDENGNPIINSYDAAYYENFDEKGRPIVSFNQDGSIKEKNIGIDKDSWADYVSNPTEARTRLNTIRAAAKDLGIYDPFTEKLTPEKFEELKGFRLDRGNDNSYNPLKQLQGIYNDEEIFNMLNTVSDATKNISNDRYGQRGGEQNKSEDITKEGFDWGGYFSGEQGWIPDYDGVPTLQMFDKQPVKQEVKQEVVEKVKEEQSFTITPQLLYKQAFIESNLDPKAKNSKGYKGLGQIGDNLISDYKKANKVDKIDPFDPKQNYAVHSWSMNELYNSSFIDKPGSTNEVKLAKALAAYNWGRGNMLKFLNDKKEKGVDIYKSTDWLSELPKETREYIDMIMYDGSTEGRPKVQENFIKTTTDNLYKPLRTLYGYKQGGEINELDMYKNYIDGVYNETDQEVDAQKIYDKLNRIHYKDAKSLGMSPANYILTHVMAKA